MVVHEVADAIDKMNCALDLNRRIIGIKFIFDEEEYEGCSAKQLTTKMPYCVMVKTAMAGKSIKAKYENFGCLASARALGVIGCDEMVSSGRHFRRLGLYQDFVTAKNVQKNMSMCGHHAHGIVLMPLEEYLEAPDIVLIVTTAYNAMRILQGYTYSFGLHREFKMCGNQALCSECTAYPFESNNINISLLCSGTRYKAGWDDDEVGMGFPFNRFLSLVRGVYATLNPTEPDGKKREIELRLKEHGRSDLTVEYGKNYYSGLYLK